MDKEEQEEAFQLYYEELDHCLSVSAGKETLRDVVIMSALVEAQVAWLARVVMRDRKFRFKPKSGTYEFSFYRQVLEQNDGSYKKFSSNVKRFVDRRNYILHNLFKHKKYSREDLDKSIKEASRLGRKIIKYLDERLMFSVTD